MADSASSIRFFVQMAINIFLCKKASQIISKRMLKEEKVSVKSYLVFILFAITLFLVNQSIFMFFKDYNLYEKIGAPRKLNAVELKSWGTMRHAELISSYKNNPQETQMKIRQLQEALQVLTHPARRLSYDSFGYSDVQYAWAFKAPHFILSTIIGSAFFFVICTVISLMNKKKADLKLAFKAQIFAMILLFIWQIDLIISTEARLNSNEIDYFDYIYKSFPIFQRRQMLKAIIIPSMSLVQIFVRFYTTSTPQKRIIQYGTLPHLQKLTLPVRESIGSIVADQHLEDNVKVALEKYRQKDKIKTQIFQLQRKNLQLILNTHREELVAKQKLGRIINYFILQ